MSPTDAWKLPRTEAPAPAPFEKAHQVHLERQGDIMPCPPCSARGRTQCTRCEGQGKLACPRCGLLDGLPPSCKKCDGRGRLNEVPCPTCKGSGQERPCSQCQDARTIKCMDCVGSGQRQCPHCRGTGQTTEVTLRRRTYDTTRAIAWNCPGAPEKLLAWLEGRLPLRQQSNLDAAIRGPVTILDRKRTEFGGPCTIVQYSRFKTTSIVSCRGEYLKLKAWQVNQLRQAVGVPMA